MRSSSFLISLLDKKKTKHLLTVLQRKICLGRYEKLFFSYCFSLVYPAVSNRFKKLTTFSTNNFTAMILSRQCFSRQTSLGSVRNPKNFRPRTDKVISITPSQTYARCDVCPSGGRSYITRNMNVPMMFPLRLL